MRLRNDATVSGSWLGILLHPRIRRHGRPLSLENAYLPGGTRYNARVQEVERFSTRQLGSDWTFPASARLKPAYRSASGFEAVLAMPSQEARVGLIDDASRRQNAPRLVDHGAHAGDIVHMP